MPTDSTYSPMAVRREISQAAARDGDGEEEGEWKDDEAVPDERVGVVEDD